MLCPKHYLLANELMKHERSADLVSIFNRYGHTCSYQTITKLHEEAARKEGTGYQLPKTVRPHCFAIKCADNFDINRDTIHGTGSFHIMNQIIIQNPENLILQGTAEVANNVSDTNATTEDQLNLSSTMDIDNSSFVSQMNATSQPLNENATKIASASGITTEKRYVAFTDDLFNIPLFAYGLSKFYSATVKVDMPLLTGFFATYYYTKERPVHIVSFCPPINEDPSSQTCAKICLQMTKSAILDTHSQQQCVLVADEKIYSNCVKQIENILSQIPNNFVTDSVKQSWFRNFTASLHSLDVKDTFDKWCQDCSSKSNTFRFWVFVLFHLLEPLIKLYIAIRSSNFSARNDAISLMVPLFFAHKRRNYAPLGARHIVDLQRASPYLLKYLATSFSVQRTKRPFSAIAVDQTIECTINKYGKGRGGITGHFNTHLIDKWTQSFAFRSLLSNITSEICGYETESNNIDSHLECSPNRIVVDQNDLQLILSKLKSENLFSLDSEYMKILFTGKIIHKDIIDSICTSYQRGFRLLKEYIEDRYLNGKIKIEEKINFGVTLRIIDADKYSGRTAKKEKAPTYNQVESYIRKIFIIGCARSIDLNNIFQHEFTNAPVSLCNRKFPNLLYQSSKSVVQKFLQDTFPSACFNPFWTTNPEESALVIDGGALLQQIPPREGKKPVHYYASQLMEQLIKEHFNNNSRIDVIFDSPKSKQIKAFIQRHGITTVKAPYSMNENSILEVGEEYNKLLRSSRAVVAKAVRDSWLKLYDKLPKNKYLVVAGPDEQVFVLTKENVGLDDNLRSNHIEADTRIFLHIKNISSFQNFMQVIIQATDTDIIILAIGYALQLGIKIFVHCSTS
ncbi:unnamed protein product, partial [Didymodactylos carnosus]